MRNQPLTLNLAKKLQTLRKPKGEKSPPERTCIGCRARRPAADLVRFGSEDGQLKVGRHIRGRGAWLCVGSVIDCFKTARKRNAVSRALGLDVTDAQLDELAAALSGSKDSG